MSYDLRGAELTMTREGGARVAAAQKKRWAALKKSNGCKAITAE
jgi:hypothetical protein